MKTRLSKFAATRSGYALLMLLGLGAVCLIIFAASVSRTSTVANMNDRNNQYIANLNAAEAAVEKAVAQMAYDFQINGMPALIQGITSGKYSTNYPTENAYWSNFEFSDGTGTANRTYVQSNYTYSGALPSQYEGLTCINSPVYRVISNVRRPGSRYPGIKAAVQVDVLAALVPITQYAIFYQGLLEFTYTAPLTINGRVHANGNVYQGSTGGYTFNGTVTTTGTITSPANDGHNSTWPHKGTYNGSPTNSVGLSSINISIGTNMAYAHQLIEVPPPAYAGLNATSIVAQSYLYNKAQVIVDVTSTAVTVSIQEAPSSSSVASQDPTKTTLTYPITNATQLASINAATNLPFLILTNKFFDQREGKTNYVVDIDVNRYRLWVATNSSVQGQTTTPTILYVANNRPFTANDLPGVRLINGTNLPSNGGLGFTVATKNPLYVKGNYNQTNSAYLASTNTTTGTVPAALMSDALTILSDNWTDSNSLGANKLLPENRDARTTTVNAAIITGVMPTTGTTTTTFSGGVHNLPRLLEDWLTVSGGQRELWLNTSIAKLYSSTMATNQFKNPMNFGLGGAYYDPPSRKFSYDLNFQDYSKQPPGFPTALVLIRKDWANPPPNTTTFYASP